MKSFRACILLGCVGSAVAAYGLAEPKDSVSVNLEDFVVTVRKELVKSDGAKLTYNVAEDVSSKGQNLLDALRKVPLVTVDAQDNIKINGSDSFKIYVNGKEDLMMESNYQKIFKSMPAESVKNIEVITEPGAQYDAEGVGGILNLITETKQPRRDGYNGSLSLGVGLMESYASGYVTAKADKVTVNANLTYAGNPIKAQKNRNESEYTYFNDESNHRMKELINQKFRYNYVQGSVNMSWEPNGRNLFTWGGNYQLMNAPVKLDGWSGMYDNRDELVYSFRTLYHGAQVKNEGATANASYRHSFNESNTHRLILAYMFNYGINMLHLDSEVSEETNYPVTMPWRGTKTDEYTREHTVQLDYSNPFGDGTHTLDAGIKGIFRHNTALGENLIGTERDNMRPVTPDDNDLNQGQDILAGYVSYKGTFIDKLTLNAGIRYEHTIMELNYRNKQGEDVRNHLNDWVPNAALTYMFGPANNLRLAYQMRISRPSLGQVNPTMLQLSEYNKSCGNPDLTSERSNILSLTYTNFGRVVGGNVGLSYRRINNAIVRYGYFEGLASVESYGNFGLHQTTTLNAYLNWNITNKMSLSLSGAVSYVDYDSRKTDDHNSGWSGNYNVNWSWMAPEKFKVNAYGGQSMHNIGLQGTDSGWYYYGVGLSRSFLKDDALTVGISARQMFHAWNKGWSRQYTDSGSTYNCYRNNSRSVSINVSWNFGHLKETVKNTGLEIENDDASSVKSKGGIGM